MELLLVALLAGMLTVLTPCVLPVLPVILGGALSGSSKWRPVVISFSLVVSIFLFTLLLKASTLLIDVPQVFWTTVSGVIVLIFGLSLLFPSAWSALSQNLGFTKSEGLLQKSAQQEGWRGMVLLGFALGPVFASCSPTYALILALVLPQNFVAGLWALVAYCFGLFIPLFLIGYGGRRVLGGFKWFADPTSSFRRGLGVLLIVVSLLLLTGYEKKIEAALLDNGLFDFTKVEQELLESFGTFDDIEDERSSDEKPLLEEDPEVQEDPVEALLNHHYSAPELVDPENWINGEAVTLAQLQEEGKVVLVNFWTFGCINCIRSLPALRELNEKYADQGLVILGVHRPEFAYERTLASVQAKVKEYGLEYLVFQDNDAKTWKAYKNRYWPAKYIIDKKGKVRYTHFGEGKYEETDEVVKYLLAQS